MTRLFVFLILFTSISSLAQDQANSGQIVVTGSHPCSLTGLGRRLAENRDERYHLAEYDIDSSDPRSDRHQSGTPTNYRQRDNLLSMGRYSGSIESSYDRENRQLNLGIGGTIGWCEDSPVDDFSMLLWQAPKARGRTDTHTNSPQIYNFRAAHDFGDQGPNVVPFCNNMELEETIALKKGDFFNANGQEFRLNCSAPNCRAISYQMTSRQINSNPSETLHQEVTLLYRDPYTGVETAHHISNAYGVILVEDENITSNLDEVEGITSCDPDERVQLQTERSAASEAARAQRNGVPLPYNPQEFFGEPYEINKPIQNQEICSLTSIVNRLERSRITPEQQQWYNNQNPSIVGEVIDYQSIMRTNDLSPRGFYRLDCPINNMSCGDQAQIMQLYDTDTSVRRNGSRIEVSVSGEISDCTIAPEHIEDSPLCVGGRTWIREDERGPTCLLDSINERNKPEFHRTCEQQEFNRSFSIAAQNVADANFSDYAVQCAAPHCKAYLFHSRSTALNRRGTSYTANDVIISRTDPRTGSVTNELILNARSVQVTDDNTRDHVQEYYEGSSCLDKLNLEGFEADLSIPSGNQALGEAPSGEGC